MKRVAEVVHVETSTEDPHAMRVDIRVVMAQESTYISSEYPKAFDMPIEVQEALIKWLVPKSAT